MGGDVETIKERLDIAEVVGGYVKLDKAGSSFKGRCPFHNEKTPSFFVSPLRQSFYCFGCGVKGDIFTFVQEIEGLSFKEALKLLADKAGIELKFSQLKAGERTELDLMRQALDEATEFFEKELEKNDAAKIYLSSRGIKDESIKKWKLGYAPHEWRALYNHMLQLGYKKEILIKAGLIKPVLDGAGKEPYDVFRDRLIFPLFDSSGQAIAFSGRALSKETEPKYLNSPDTALFTKSEVLYGLNLAKEQTRKKNYAVLVEGQMDLVLSHQAGVDNTVASSGTAFTEAHLQRLKKLSPRIILAFDGDKAGSIAAEKATVLALSLGLEVKVARLPEGKDPADLVKEAPDKWKEVLRSAKPAIEHFLEEALKSEKDKRKASLLIKAKILPLVVLLESSMERSHFVSLVAKHTGIKEELIWDDLKKTKISTHAVGSHGMTSKSVTVESDNITFNSSQDSRSRKEVIEERLTEVRTWLKELPESSNERDALVKEEGELAGHLEKEMLARELGELNVMLARAETLKDDEEVGNLAKRIQEVLKKMSALDAKKVL